MFRKRRRCQNLCPSPHPAYHGRQCHGGPEHKGLCFVKSGYYRHYWNQAFYERLGRAMTKEVK